jgi:putative spermidine/putrescine transport system substrate-binding protein
MGVLGMNPDWIDDPDKRLLLAAPTDDLVDQSFAFWEEFKPNIDVFWHEGSECPQLLISGELDMCTALNGRISDAQKVGAPIAICWECGRLISTDSWVIPKGLAEQDPDKFYLAQLFLAWNTFPEVMVNHSKYISYGPTNLKALPSLKRRSSTRCGMSFPPRPPTSA